MAHEVTFKLPDRELGKAALEISVKKDGDMLGRFKASKGGASWVPRDRTYGFKLSWTELSELLEEHGKKEGR